MKADVEYVVDGTELIDRHNLNWIARMEADGRTVVDLPFWMNRASGMTVIPSNDLHAHGSLSNDAESWLSERSIDYQRNGSSFAIKDPRAATLFKLRWV